MRKWWVGVFLVVLAGCSGLPVDTDASSNDGATVTPESSSPTPIERDTPTQTDAETPTRSPTPIPDSDGDGLDNQREAALGTDPNSPDSDNDGLSDKKEVALDSDPLSKHSDSDGLADGREVTELGTSPVLEDSDFDRLPDDKELEIGTSPTEADTDGDGWRDSREWELDGHDPLAADSDHDLLNDTYEEKLGTDPNNPHSDEDDIKDGREVQLGIDPTSPDTDHDGLPDDWEARGTPHTTNDELPDADPGAKDLYVVFTVRNTSISDSKIATVEQHFAEMPVENPDGSEGIDLHLSRKSSSPYAYRGFSETPVRTMTIVEDGDRYCSTMSVRVESQGCANTVSVVSEPKTNVMVHEILHAAMGCGPGGEPGDGHTTEGWMAGLERNQSQYMSNHTRRSLNRWGITSRVSEGFAGDRFNNYLKNYHDTWASRC